MKCTKGNVPKLSDKLVQQIDRLPDPLPSAVLEILRAHVGRDRAVGRLALLRIVQESEVFDPAAGRHTRPLVNVSERELRMSISTLRDFGLPVCSAPGRVGGYYLAADGVELHQFLMRELDSRIRSLARTRRRMFAGGLTIFGRQGELAFETSREVHHRCQSMSPKNRRPCAGNKPKETSNVTTI